jgi:hypothetical protein
MKRVVLLILTVLLVSGHAAAQVRAEVSASVSATTVEVSEPFTLTLRATVHGDVEPDAPTLEPPSGFSVSNPTVSRFSLGVRGFGGAMNQKTLTATWQLIATTPGTYTFTAPSVRIGGDVVRASGSLGVVVVPAGQRPPGAGPPPIGRLLGPGVDIDLDGLLDDEPDPSDPRAQELALPREPDPYFFLRLMADKKKAYVGEQITVTYWLYNRIETIRYGGPPREPPFSDFVRMELEGAPGTDDDVITNVGAWRYSAKLLDRVALFPLRAGKLRTGRLSSTIETARFSKPQQRESNDLEIEVVEPPLEGRPPGYRLGTVGRYKLTAEVRPREIKQGDTIAVQVRLNGLGHLPVELDVPARTGVEWLDPVKKEELTVKAGRVGGWRTFGYAVRIKEHGVVDLGAMELPFWDLERGRYEVARVELGTVLVQEGDRPVEPTSEDDRPSEDPFTKLPSPRTELGAHDTADDGLEPRLFWALVAVPPVGVLLAGLFERALGGMRRRRRARADDPGALADRALADMRGDAKDAAAAAERALHHAIEAGTGLKSRALLLSALAVAVRQKGASDSVAVAVVSLLEVCATIRFEPSADPGALDQAAVRATVKDLLRLRRDGGTS